MKISPIIFSKQNYLYQKNIVKNIDYKKSSYTMPDYRYYQSFLGGYTLDLAKTYANLKPEEYPNTDIAFTIEEELKKPNTDKTLYDVHFEKYKKLLDCYSLEQLKSDEFKQEFPQLQNVVSEADVLAMPGSFIDNCRGGKYEIFDNQEDLTLQLIKLYWGKGFSLADLSNYIADNSPDNKPVNLIHTLKKLNIPLMNRRYASVLKLSNKEYNEKFISEMSIRLREAREAREQYAQGEAVVIPRGELSEAHKKHISESLKKHFQNHPEKILEMSERQKKFYKENNEAREELSEVMDFAWNITQEGISIKKYLSKFLKKTNQQELDILDAIAINSPVMKSFWDKNTWAKEKFSSAILKGWENVKRKDKFDAESIYITNLYPPVLLQKIKKWIKEQNIDVSQEKIGTIYVFKNRAPYSKRETKLIGDAIDAYFMSHPNEADDFVTAMQLALINFANNLFDDSSPVLDIVSSRKKLNALKNIYRKIYSNNPIYTESKRGDKVVRIPRDGMESNNVTGFYYELLGYSCKNEIYEIIKYLENIMERAYSAVLQTNNGRNEEFLSMLNFTQLP